MVNLNALLKEVYEVYPRGIFLEDETYKQRNEYLKREQKKENTKKSDDFRVIYQNIKEIFDNYEVVNWSNIEEHPCFEFVILLHKNQPILDDDTDLIHQLNGVRHDLFLYVSYISNYYCYYIRETKYSEESGEWSFKKIRLEDNQNIVALIQDMNTYLTNIGYELLSQEILSYRLPDIDLELVSFGAATIFHCLFTDLLDFILKE